MTAPINPTGFIVNLKTTDPLHFDGNGKAAIQRESDDVSGSFADALKKSLDKVNDLQVDAEDLSEKMIFQPESVDVHQVMIATQKAEMSLTFAKTIRDEALKAYRDLINMR